MYGARQEEGKGRKEGKGREEEKAKEDEGITLIILDRWVLLLTRQLIQTRPDFFVHNRFGVFEENQNPIQNVIRTRTVGGMVRTMAGTLELRFVIRLKTQNDFLGDTVSDFTRKSIESIPLVVGPLQ